MRGSQERSTETEIPELEGGAVLRKKKDCVPEGPWAGDMISPMGHDSKKKLGPLMQFHRKRRPA